MKKPPPPPPKTYCCKAPIKYVNIKNETGSNHIILYCSKCLTLFDGNGLKLVSSTEKVA